MAHPSPIHDVKWSAKGDAAGRLMGFDDVLVRVGHGLEERSAQAW
jgi:hypothetical protein